MPQSAAELFLQLPFNDSQRDKLFSATSSEEAVQIIGGMNLPDDVSNKAFDAWRLSETERLPDFRSEATLPTPEAPMTARDWLVGAGKGLANTAFGVSEMVVPSRALARGYSLVAGTPVSRPQWIPESQWNAAEGRPSITIPANRGEKYGQTAEQMLEFFVPGPAEGRLAKGAWDAGLAFAQSRSPVMAAASGALGAALPSRTNIANMGPRLQRSAEHEVAQALGATQTALKREAQEVAPWMLKNGISGTRDELLQRAIAQTDATLGPQIRTVVDTAAQQGAAVPSADVNAIIDGVIAKFTRPNPAKPTALDPVFGFEAKVDQLKQLKDYIAGYGSDIPVDEAQRIKILWDDIVYGTNSLSPRPERESAAVFKSGADALRGLIEPRVPGLGSLNEQFGHWNALRKVLTATDVRTGSQGQSLAQQMATGTSALVGLGASAARGADTATTAMVSALAAGAGNVAMRLMQSPWFRTTASGPAKAALATALGNGNVVEAAHLASRIIATAPAAVRATLAPTPTQRAPISIGDVVPVGGTKHRVTRINSDGTFVGVPVRE